MWQFDHLAVLTNTTGEDYAFRSVTPVIGNYRARFMRVATAAALLIPLTANAAELSDEARGLGKERRNAVIAQARQQVVDLEK